MAVDERRGSVVFAEQAAVDVVESISGNQSVPAGGARETLLCQSVEVEGQIERDRVGERKRQRERDFYEKSTIQKRKQMGGATGSS